MSMGSGGTPDVPYDDDAPGYTLTVNLPADAVPQHGLAIVSYFDNAGETCYGLALEGSASLSSIIGLLELVKARVFKEAADW